MYITRSGRVYPYNSYVRKNDKLKYALGKKDADSYERLYVPYYKPSSKRIIKLRRIQEIVMRKLKGETCQSIADDYGFSRQAISDIIIRYNKGILLKPRHKLKRCLYIKRGN